MTEADKIEVRRRYSKLKFTQDEANAIYDCWMQGVNRDGGVWVTWTDVQRLICDLHDVGLLEKAIADIPHTCIYCGNNTQQLSDEPCKSCIKGRRPENPNWVWRGFEEVESNE